MLDKIKTALEIVEEGLNVQLDLCHTIDMAEKLLEKLNDPMDVYIVKNEAISLLEFVEKKKIKPFNQQKGLRLLLLYYNKNIPELEEPFKGFNERLERIVKKVQEITTQPERYNFKKRLFNLLLKCRLKQRAN